PSGEVAEVWCDMTTDGGGWTLGFLRNTASVASQADFGFGDEGLPSLAVSPAAASASAVPEIGWIDLNTFTWDTLRLGAYASGAQTWLSKDIARSELRIPFGSDGYYLYGGASGYYWCGGAASYTDSGIGAVDNPAGAPPDCKEHGYLGSGWDFSESPYANAGLTLCGGDGSYWLYAGYGVNLVYYGTPGGAQAIWVR
ncbi:MAG: Fibrinogen beta and gamma chain, C-terminal globular domain, partial [Pseudomonadota bacterium]